MTSRIGDFAQSELMTERMFPMTLEGFDQAMKELKRKGH